VALEEQLRCHLIIGGGVGGRRSAHGWELALEWIESPEETTAKTGWNVLGGLAALRDDETLDVERLQTLLTRVGSTIHAAPYDVRYAMNNFVISLGTHVAPLQSGPSRRVRRSGALRWIWGTLPSRSPSLRLHPQSPCTLRQEAQDDALLVEPYQCERCDGLKMPR
jgi:hypothetical protein